jgi:hypothetical protein
MFAKSCQNTPKKAYPLRFGTFLAYLVFRTRSFVQSSCGFPVETVSTSGPLIYVKFATEVRSGVRPIIHNLLCSFEILKGGGGGDRTRMPRRGALGLEPSVSAFHHAAIQEQRVGVYWGSNPLSSAHQARSYTSSCRRPNGVRTFADPETVWGDGGDLNPGSWNTGPGPAVLADRHHKHPEHLPPSLQVRGLVLRAFKNTLQTLSARGTTSLLFFGNCPRIGLRDPIYRRFPGRHPYVGGDCLRPMVLEG